MSEQINPGDGYRLIDKHTDKPREGDQYLYWNKWRDRPKPLAPWDFTHTYRRRIPAKPEAISMMDPSGMIAVTALPETVTIEQEFPGEESDFVIIETVQYARQLADWLTRYADWREAQDAAK